MTLLLRRTLYSYMTVLGLLGLLHTAYAQDNHPLKNEVSKLIKHETNIDFKKTPGLLIGISDKDSSWVFQWGVNDIETRDTFGHDMIFGIGGLTKVFTALLAYQMAESGIINLQAPITDYLPDSVGNNAFLKDITVENLISHVTSFDKIPAGFGMNQHNLEQPYQYYGKSEIYAYLQTYKPKNNKKTFAYSHLGYAVLQYILENASNRAYTSLMADKILAPSGLRHTYIADVPPDMVYAKGYNKTGKETKPWVFNSFEASMGAYSDINDLMRFADLMSGKSAYYAPKTIERALSLELPTGIDKTINTSGGWYRLKVKGYYDVFSHMGMTQGQQAFIGFVRETKTSVVVLSNSTISLDQLGISILRMINYNWSKRDGL